MTDQRNALIVGIAQIIDHPSVYMGGPSRNSMRIAETIVKEFGADLARADRAAPEGEGYFGPMGIPHWSSALTPPPAAPTDNTALVEAALGMRRIVEEIDGAMTHGAWRDEKGRRLKDTPEWVSLYNALASREAPPACQQEAVTAARAEIERLTKERDAQYEENVNRIAMQAKAEAERDEARSMLADAERDMRQRAADDMLHFDYDGAGRKLADRILALPLKHAGREEGV